MKMKIAIGIPAYKAQKTIEECLSSINIQSFRDNVDVIISNDNPGDDYSYLKKMFPKLHFTLLPCESNAGPGVARNRAIEAAIQNQDDYIMFMDADDILYHPYVVENMHKSIKQNPNYIQCQAIFLQTFRDQQGNTGLAPQQNINHPWSFARLTSVPFLKENNIRFGTQPNMEDGEFNWKIHLLIDGSQLQVCYIKDYAYVWKEGSEHSITRTGTEINNGIPIYNFGMCQIGASMAAKSAAEFALSKNPFNGNIQKFITEQMINHYFTYYESIEKCPKFSEQLWWLSKWFYHNCYVKFCQNIPQEVLDKFYMGTLASKGRELSKFPELTFRQWFDKISTEEFSMEQLVEIRSKLPPEVIEAERKSGSLTLEAKEDPLKIFN